MKTTRKYNGITYHMLYPDKESRYPKPLSHKTAMRIAREERELTRLARVIKIQGGYGVFISHNLWLK